MQTTMAELRESLGQVVEIDLKGNGKKQKAVLVHVQSKEYVEVIFWKPAKKNGRRGSFETVGVNAADITRIFARNPLACII